MLHLRSISAAMLLHVKNYTMDFARIHLPQVDSTNNYLSSYLKAHPDTGPVLLVSDYQDSGRGQGEHVWESRRGENLLVSILLFPAFLSASDQFHLSRMVSLALCDVLAELGLPAAIKWPNDILVSGRKVAGILIENSIRASHLSHSILGIGLNVNQREFPEFHWPATSLANEGAELRVSEVLTLLESFLLERYGQLESGKTDILEQDYLERLFALEKKAFYTSGGKTFEGRILGVDSHGQLILERNGEWLSFAFQEIRYLRS